MQDHDPISPRGEPSKCIDTRFRAVRGIVCDRCRLADAWLVQDPDLTTAIEHPGCYVRVLRPRHGRAI